MQIEDCQGRFESLSPGNKASEDGANKEKQKSVSLERERRSKSAPKARETMKYVRITPVQLQNKLSGAIPPCSKDEQ